MFTKPGYNGAINLLLPFGDSARMGSRILWELEQ